MAERWLRRELLFEEENERALRRERVFRDQTNPLDYMTDQELVSKFRLSRNAILHVIDVVYSPSWKGLQLGVMPYRWQIKCCRACTIWPVVVFNASLATVGIYPFHSRQSVGACTLFAMPFVKENKITSNFQPPEKTYYIIKNSFIEPPTCQT